MFYLDYAKPVGDRYILNFFADTIEDLKDVPATTPFISRNGTNYGVPLDTSVVTVVENGVKVNYVLQQGKYIVGGDIAPFNIVYSDTAPSDTSKLWIKTEEPDGIEFVRNTMGDTAAYNEEESVIFPAHYGGVVLSGAVCNKHLYIFGDLEGAEDDTVIDYDITNDATSTFLTGSDTRYFGGTCVTVGSKIYIFGGTAQRDLPSAVDALDTIREFDTATKKITVLSAVLNNKVYFASAVAVGAQIYIFGGKNKDGYFNTIQRFDTVTKTITALATVLAAPAASPIVGLVGSKIYILAGEQRGGYLDTIQIFDPATDTIITLPQTTRDIFTRCYGAIGTKILFATGDTGDASGATADVYEFDTTTLETKVVGVYRDWEELMGGAVYENILYGFGGWNFVDTIAKFTFTFPLPSNNILVQETLDKNLFDLTPAPARVQIGAQNVWKGNENNEAEFVDAYLHNGTSWVNVNTGEVLVE